MNITLNGEARQIAPGTTVAQLVARLSGETGQDPRAIAVERNREIVPKSEHALTVLDDGDLLEIVQFVGGG
jgi:sulfur carrier protein